jgi:hypothetical protein
MKAPTLLVAALAVLAAAVTASSQPLRRAAAPPRLPPATHAGELALYGHVRTLTRRGSRFELRFDPALLLGGTTGQRAAEEDGAVPPGEPVPNDNYTRDETHKLLTFVVPASARATVVTHGPGGIGAAVVPVSELAEIVRGRNPRRRPIFGGGLGFWIRVAVDTVRSLDQQYHP